MQKQISVDEEAERDYQFGEGNRDINMGHG